jgi:hypothetical protein
MIKEFKADEKISVPNNFKQDYFLGQKGVLKGRNKK